VNADLHTQLAKFGRNQRAARRPVDLTDIQAAAEAAGIRGKNVAPPPDDTTEFEPDEGDLIMVDIQTGESEAAPTDKINRRRWAGRAIVAAAAVILVIVAVAMFDSTEESIQIDVVDDPSDVDAPEPTEQVVLSPGEQALAVSGGYIEAFNSGDAGAVLALLTPDVALSEKFTGTSPDFEAMDPADFEQQLAWDTAQGTTYTSPECAVTDESSGASVSVSCAFGWLYPAEKAVGEPPVPTTLDLVVAPDGISQLAFEYPPIFGVPRFDNWLVLNHGEDSQGVEYGDWNSVAEAQQGGILRAQYVKEWAAELEANN
jgi:hypothetical protein